VPRDTLVVVPPDADVPPVLLVPPEALPPVSTALAEPPLPPEPPAPMPPEPPAGAGDSEQPLMAMARIPTISLVLIDEVLRVPVLSCRRSHLARPKKCLNV
jgi:hypothetical protein